MSLLQIRGFYNIYTYSIWVYVTFQYQIFSWSDGTSWILLKAHANTMGSYTSNNKLDWSASTLLFSDSRNFMNMLHLLPLSLRLGGRDRRLLLAPTIRCSTRNRLTRGFYRRNLRHAIDALLSQKWLLLLRHRQFPPHGRITAHDFRLHRLWVQVVGAKLLSVCRRGLVPVPARSIHVWLWRIHVRVGPEAATLAESDVGEEAVNDEGDPEVEDWVKVGDDGGRVRPPAA